MGQLAIITLIVVTLHLTTTLASTDRPHIIFILADDLGWNDVSFHGSGDIQTPNIDALAYSGLILNNYYVAPMCTPSRSALMTGKYPIHTGMQHDVLYGGEPRGLPLEEKLLPQYLKELGYTNRIVGKWHLGFYTKEYTPHYRGFDSHIGYWTGHQDYYDHSTVESPYWGLDMRRNLDVAYDLHGEYSTDVFTQESVKIINQHNASTPLFLYLAHAAVHAGNPYFPLQAPDNRVEKFSYVSDFKRRKFAAVVSKLDDSVGAVVKALADKNMLENSIIIFSTDNGGAAAGYDGNKASNYPLRGLKSTIWEGGVRGSGLFWSPLIKQPQRVAQQMFHISDWLPTLLEAAGANSSEIGNIDGKSQWQALLENKDSPRTEIVHNIDDITGQAAVSVGPWKLVQGTNNAAWDSWFGPSGREYDYNVTLVTNSPVGHALSSVDMSLSSETILKLRDSVIINCSKQDNKQNPCSPKKEVCLFNIDDDPCEMSNLAQEFPDILENLKEVLKKYNDTAVPPGNLPWDPKGDPKNFNYVWTNFGDM